jgi:hypothetical protein
LAIAGTKDMRPKHSKWFGKANAGAMILPPVPTEGLTLDDVPALRERCRDVIRAALADLRTRYGNAG